MPEDTRENAAHPLGSAIASRQVLTFHASFDHGADADFGSGDLTIYTATVHAVSTL
jgi:hypothetical protein